MKIAACSGYSEGKVNGTGVSMVFSWPDPWQWRAPSRNRGFLASSDDLFYVLSAARKHEPYFIITINEIQFVGLNF